MIKITAFFTSLLITMGNLFAALLPKAPAPADAGELMSLSDTVKKKELSDVVYAVDLSAFTSDERYSAIALQGIVAKKDPCIYLLLGGEDRRYLADIEKSGTAVIRTDKNGNRWTYEALISEFSDYIGDGGYTLYENSDFAEGLNVAVNFATAYGWLPVPVSAKEKAESCGLTLKKDLTREKYGYAFQRKYFRELKNSFEKGTVVHVRDGMMGMRDLAIEQGWFCFYSSVDSERPGGGAFMRDVLRWSGKNTTVFGWCEYEKKTVNLISESGGHLIASDYCYNCSYLSQLECETVPEASPAQASTAKDKHFVTLVFSDGDNCQWIENGYGEYYELTGNHPGAVISWTFSPVLRSLCPPAFDRVSAFAGENTSFVCGPSGAGYCNPSVLDAKSLDLFSTQTAGAMLKNGQRVITILDDYSAIRDGRIGRSFDYFSRFDNIDGGILFLDPGRYEAGKGRVWFSNGKPFASVRLSLWSEDGYDGATDEWLRRQADTVGDYPVSPGTVDGYSVICIHAWSMKPDAVAKFIGMLAPHVQVLSADEFIATMKANVPPVTASPVS